MLSSFKRKEKVAIKYFELDKKCYFNDLKKLIFLKKSI